MARTVSGRLNVLRNFLNYLVNCEQVLKSCSFPAFSRMTKDFFSSITDYNDSRDVSRLVSSLIEWSVSL